MHDRTLIGTIKTKLKQIDMAIVAASSCAAEHGAIPVSGAGSLIPQHLHTLRDLEADMRLLLALAHAGEHPAPGAVP